MSGTESRTSLTYRDAGVDIDAGDELVEQIKPLAASTRRPGADGSLGGFGGLFDLKAAGFKAKMPGGTFYLYVPAPTGTAGGLRFANAEEASQYLIKELCISTVPWDDAGAFLRFGATFESAGRADDARVLEELGRRLARAGLVFGGGA